MAKLIPGQRVGSAPCVDDPALQRAWDAVYEVTDPEIPVLSIVELGMVNDIRYAADGQTVDIDLTPTFAGCPALDHIREQVAQLVEQRCQCVAHVHVVFDPPWSSDRITEVGRQVLKKFGFAPPTAQACGPAAATPPTVPCPFCDSTQTTLESIFGPTLCRSIHYCQSCLQSFEHFKTV